VIALELQPFASALFLHFDRSVPRVMHGGGIKLRVAHLRQVTRSFVASADWMTPARKPI